MEFGFNVGYLKKSWNVILLVIPFSDTEIFAGCTFHTASNRMCESEQDHPNLTTTGCTQCTPWPLHHELQLGGSAAVVKLTQVASGSAPVVNSGCSTVGG